MKSIKNTALGLAVLMLLAAACGPDRAELAGKYRAKGRAVSLELDEDGRGVWRAGYDETVFKWSRKKGRIVLHTEEGGAFAGVAAQEGLRLDLPGVGEVLFEPMP